MSGKISYQEHGTNTYMIYKLEAAEATDSIVMGMMDNNQIRGLLPFRFYQKDEERYVQYETTNVISMRQYMDQGISKEKYLWVVDSLLQVLMDIQAYMIPVNTIALSTHSIFLNYERSQVILLCVPVKNRTDKDLVYGLLEFLSESKLDNQDDMGCISRLITYINQFDVLDIYNAKRYVQELIQGRNPIWGKMSVDDPEEENLEIEQEEQIYRQIKVPEYNEEFVQRREVIANMENLSEENDEEEPKIGFFSRLFRKKEKTVMEIDEDTPLSRKEQKRLKKEQKRLLKEQKKLEKEQKRALKEQEEFAIPGEEGKLASTYRHMENGGGREEIRERNVLRTGNLIRIRTSESYLVHREVNRIGSNPDLVDIYITDNYAINENHAAIIQKNNEFFVESNAVANNTYLNGRALKPRSQALIRDGDFLRMADEEFKFRAF